ncbi:MAG: ATP-binding protein [Candidatus Omnitrophota bacterium]
MLKIALAAKIENLEAMFRFIRKAAQAQGFDEKKVSQVQLAAEEALVNVIKYAYPDKSGDLEINCNNKEGSLEIEISDSGIPFDPLSLPEPDIHSPMEKRKIGGLGIFMLRKIMDEVKYKREDNRNILTLIKH